MSSGAIAAGLTPLRLARRPRDLATQQAAASVGQGLLVAVYTAAFARHGIQAGQILLTADDLMRRAHYRNAQRTLDRLLELGVLPVVNENDTVATDEIRFGDNDRLAALVAHVVRAGALVLLSDVDGLYDFDPRHPGARRISRVGSRADLDGVTLGGRPGGKPYQGRAPLRYGRPAVRVGTGGMATKVDAALIATEAGIPTVVARADQAAAALAGEPVGTYFAPHDRRPATRQLWLAHAAVGPRHADAGRGRGPRGRGPAGRPCCPRGSPGWREVSTPGTRSTCPTPTAMWSRAGWSTTTRPRSRRSWAGPPGGSPPGRDPGTSGRSCTATTS